MAASGNFFCKDAVSIAFPCKIRASKHKCGCAVSGRVVSFRAIPILLLPSIDTDTPTSHLECGHQGFEGVHVLNLRVTHICQAGNANGTSH
jgi:hypothetical protein